MAGAEEESEDIMERDRKNHSRPWLRHAVIIASALCGLSACVYAPAPYAYGPGYYAAPAPVVVDGYWGWHRGR